MKEILVACTGNIFLGDDAFGVEVARELVARPLPSEVWVMDFGIRSYDLAYALAEGYEAVILVDATRQGHAPGTLYLIEPNLGQLGELEAAAVDAHSMDPVRVLQMALSLGARPARLYLVGCEPEDCGGEEGRLGLSAPVQAAVPRALEMIESLVGKLLTLGEGPAPFLGLHPVSGCAPG